MKRPGPQKSRRERGLMFAPQNVLNNERHAHSIILSKIQNGNEISQEGILDHTHIKYTPNNPIHISGVPSYIAPPL